MHKIWTPASLAAVFAVCGCSVEVKVSDDEGVRVRAPGIDVRVNEEEGVSVQAPGVDVRVSDEEGVSVKAPGVEIRVDTEDGTTHSGKTMKNALLTTDD